MLGSLKRLGNKRHAKFLSLLWLQFPYFDTECVGVNDKSMLFLDFAGDTKNHLPMPHLAFTRVNLH
jgi:hypothetical protein